MDFTGKNPEPTPAGKAPIDCSGNTPDINRTWCSNLYAYQTVDPHDPAARFVYVVPVAAPAPIPPSPGDGNGRGGH